MSRAIELWNSMGFGAKINASAEVIESFYAAAYRDGLAKAAEIADDVRLQDGDLYQPFAYQIESELDISVFYDLVKKLVHQAGTNLFVNRVISTTANISANITVETRKNVFVQLNSVFSTLDSIQKTLYKTLDTDSTSVTDNLSYSLSTTLPTDTVTPTDSLTFNIQLALSDSFTLTDNTSYNFNKVSANFHNLYLTAMFNTFEVVSNMILSSLFFTYHNIFPYTDFIFIF